MYCDLPDTIKELKNKITQPVRNIDEDNLKNAYKNMKIVYALNGEKKVDILNI